MKSIFIILISLLLLATTSWIVVYLFKHKKRHIDDTIYCIMITGKSSCRYELAKRSIANFMEQTHKYKHLIIINHGEKQLSSSPEFMFNRDSISEYMVEKADNTLGDMRNMAIDRVPINSTWTTWDDDDYRSARYLEYLYNTMNSKKVSSIKFINRIEVNVKTNYVWKTTLRSGLMTIMSRKKTADTELYTRKDTMEDQALHSNLLHNGHTFYILDNDPYIYLRMVHNNNTSLYVDNNKTEIRRNIKGTNLREEEIDEMQQNQVLKFFSNYYKEGIRCIQASEI